MTRAISKVATLQSKERAWEGNPVDPNFRWQTQTGDVLRPQEMRTSHLFNSLKMLWNHSVPAYARVMPFNHQYKVNIPRAQRKWAIANLFNELMNRPDRTPGMEESLRQMAEWVTKKALPK